MRNWTNRLKLYGPGTLALAGFAACAPALWQLLRGEIFAGAVWTSFALACVFVGGRLGRWWVRYSKGRRHLGRQEYAEAEQEFRALIDENRFPRDDPRRAMILDGFATAVKGIGDFADAEPLAQAAWESAKAAWAPESAQAAAARVNLGNIYLDLARFEDAECCFRDSLEIFRRLRGDRNPIVAVCENNLGVVAAGKRDHVQAESLYRKAFAQLDKRTLVRSPNRGLARCNLAWALLYQGKLEEAETLLQEAIGLFRGDLPKKQALHAYPRNLMAEIRIRQVRWIDAENLAQEALFLAEDALGTEHPLVGRMLDTLARTLMGQERFAEAETACMRALRLREEYLVPTHPDLADTVVTFADLLRRTGRPDEAADLLDQSRERQQTFRNETETAIRGGGQWQIREN